VIRIKLEKDWMEESIHNVNVLYALRTGHVGRVATWKEYDALKEAYDDKFPFDQWTGYVFVDE